MTKTAKKPTKLKREPSGSGAGQAIGTLSGESIPVKELEHIAPYLRPFAVRCDSLTRDPRNTRLHKEFDLQTTADSLRRFGQRDLLKFDPESRVVKIGNGRHECATDPKWNLKWKWIAAVPEDLPAAELKLFAIVHNRSGEKSEWDQDELDRQLDELSEELEEFEETDAGFSEDELDALLKDDFETAHAFAPKREKPAAEKPAGEEKIAAQFKIIINCRDEKHQRELIAEFEKRGYEFTAPNVT